MTEEAGPKNDAVRAKTYYQKMRSKGMTRVSAWIPDDDSARGEFWDSVSQLEAQWRARGLPTVDS